MWKLAGNLHISSGQTVRHTYWWGGPSKGPQNALASPHTNIETASNQVNTVRQGFRVSPSSGCVYTVDVTCEDVFNTGLFGEYEVWVQGWS
ncbi:MAG TPA: hypothetical protein VF520_02705 [Thermoleophilaceae bacterium]|jgi:hypothetical protein